MKRAAFLPALLLTLLLSAPGTAQAPAGACPYHECALRVEPRRTATVLVRGAEGEVVGRVGLFGIPELQGLVAPSDSAVAYARSYQRGARVGGGWLMAGTIASVAPIFLTGWSDEARLAGALAGSAATLYGALTLADAQRALSRAIWWYNGTLDR
jgi:hypothetical protein